MINVKEIREIEIVNPEKIVHSRTKAYFDKNCKPKVRLFVHNAYFRNRTFLLGYFGIPEKDRIKEIPAYLYVLEEVSANKFKILASTLNEAEDLGISVVISSVAKWNLDNQENGYVNIFYHDIDSGEFIKRVIQIEQ